MNLLDLAVVVALVGAGVGGYRLGLLARVTSWIGLGLGLAIAARLLPAAIGLVDSAQPTSRLLVAAVVLIGGSFIGQALGLVVGSKLRMLMPPGPFRVLDRGAGAFAGCLGVVLAVWVLLPAMADIPGQFARAATTSVVGQAIDDLLPAPPNTAQALRRIVGNTDFPQVFEGLVRAPDTGPPPADTGLTAAVLARVSASTLKIEGKSCNRIQDGSGFVTSGDTVVTNAHVVAGDKPGTLVVIRPDGRRLKATVAVMDTDRDLAVLKVPGLGLNALSVVSKTASDATTGAIFGHPGGQDPLAVTPAKISRRVDAVGRDLYDGHQTRRDVFVVAAKLAPGYSGGPMVDTSGQVVGVAFAIAPDRDAVSYVLSDVELKGALAEDRGGDLSTGPCLRD